MDLKVKYVLKSDQKYKALNRKYCIKKKGSGSGLEDLKLHIFASKRGTMTGYDQRTKCYKQNRLYRVDKKRLYKELNGKMYRGNIGSASRGKSKILE